MKAFTFPPMRPGDWRGALLEKHEITGLSVWSVSVRGRDGSSRRRWYWQEAHAFAFALDQSETRRLPFFDLRDGGES